MFNETAVRLLRKTLSSPPHNHNRQHYLQYANSAYQPTVQYEVYDEYDDYGDSTTIVPQLTHLLAVYKQGTAPPHLPKPTKHEKV